MDLIVFVAMLQGKEQTMRLGLLLGLVIVLVVIGCQTYTTRDLSTVPGTSPASGAMAVPRGAMQMVQQPVVCPTCPQVPPSLTPPVSPPPKAEESAAKCIIYSLRDLGGDGQMATWVAETISQVIEPRSWQSAGGTGKLSVNPTAQVLVVYQTPQVHRQVETFLEVLKRSVERVQGPATSGGVVPAKFADAAVPAPPRGPVLTYPVPAPVRQPKHLFHFVIRYEGDGIIDGNVVDFVKRMQENSSSSGPANCVAPGSMPACQPGNSCPQPACTNSAPTTLPMTPGVLTGPVASGNDPVVRQQLEQLIRGMTGVPVPMLPPAGGPPTGSLPVVPPGAGPPNSSLAVPALQSSTGPASVPLVPSTLQPSTGSFGVPVGPASVPVGPPMPGTPQAPRG
jgi:hypothetical protein